MQSWWRLNRHALAALAVLVPVALAVIGGAQWYAYFSVRPVLGNDVAVGTEHSWAGATWGPVRAEAAAANEAIPADARLVVVTIPVQPGSSGLVACTPARLTDGIGRSWAPATSMMKWPYDPAAPPLCPGSSADDPAAGFDLRVPFLVPADARGPFTVEVVVDEELPDFLRFRLDL